MKFKTHPREANLYLVTKDGVSRVCEFTTVATEMVTWPKSFAQAMSLTHPKAYTVLQWRNLQMDVVQDGKVVATPPPYALQYMESHDSFKYITEFVEKRNGTNTQ